MYSYTKKYLIILHLLFIPLVSLYGYGLDNKLSDSTSYGNLVIAEWEDDKQSAFSFSFDDGLISQYQNVKNIFDSYGFKSTHYLLPPYLTEQLPGIWRYGTWPMFLEMYNDDYELGSHTLYHYYLDQIPLGDTLTPNTVHYEMYHSRKIISQRTRSNDCISFAYPYGVHNNFLDSIASLYYESARAIGINPNSSSINGLEWFSLNSYAVIFSEPRNTPDDDLDELIAFENWIENLIQLRGWVSS